MKRNLLLIVFAFAALAAHAQESNAHVTFNPLEGNRCSVENMMLQGNGDIITHVFIADRDNPHNNTQVLGVYVLKMSPSTMQVMDSLFLADTVPPFYLYARNPRGEGNIRANIEPDSEGNTQLRIAHFTDDDLHIDHGFDVVVPLCEGTALDDAFSYMLDCQGNLIMKYYKENDGGTEGHIVRYDVDGNLLCDAIIPESQYYIRTMEVFKESPLEYCQWRKGSNGHLNFYVLDSTFQLKNTYVINKIIN